MAQSIVIYGIKNCDTMKKAFQWLESNGVAYQFHDYKKTGLDSDQLKQWCDTLGYEKLLNTRGTTWRNIPDAEKRDITEQKARQLMLEHTSLIKRPVLQHGNALLVGFDPTTWQTLL